jgi:hypothetical protein
MESGGKGGKLMDARQKFLAMMGFEPSTPCLKWEFGYWAGTVRRWYAEGLPQGVGVPAGLGEGDAVRAEALGQGKEGSFSDVDVHKFLDLDEGMHRIPVRNFVFPFYEEEVLEDHGDWVLRRDSWGVTRRQRKDRAAPEAFVGSLIESWDDWERLKAERLQANTPGRMPQNWGDLCRSYRNRTFPLVLGGYHGFFGTPRYLLGDQRVLTTFLDDPKLIHAINDHLCDFWIALYDRYLADTTVDMALIWEDMCYKNGPLISPAMFQEFMLPYYKRLTSFFRDHGVNIIFVDTDGDARKIIPLLLEGGVTGFYPVEVAAGLSVLELRESFPRLQMIGGVDKRSLFEGRGESAIEAELEHTIVPTIGTGGFIPTVDHLIPPETPWSNFAHYRRILNEAIDRRCT